MLSWGRIYNTISDDEMRKPESEMLHTLAFTYREEREISKCQRNRDPNSKS